MKLCAEIHSNTSINGSNLSLLSLNFAQLLVSDNLLASNVFLDRITTIFSIMVCDLQSTLTQMKEVDQSLVGNIGRNLVNVCLVIN